MLPQPRKSILEIQPYKGGLSKAKGGKKVLKLSSNETPWGPSPKAIEAYQNCANTLERYPDGGATILREAIGKVYGLDPAKIVCGAGSDELISFLCLAYAEQGDEVIYTEHGFLMYKIYSLGVGASPVSVPEKDLKTNVDNILKAVTAKTKIVFIANPNNPTGSYIAKDEIIRLRRGLPENVLLVLDGAYAEYVTESDYTDGADIVDMGENTVMTRTFSKIYGLSSLRIGWAYCPASIADVLNRVRGPFNVSTPAILAAAEAVSDTAYTARMVEENNKAIAYMEKELAKIGIKTYPTVANFILVDFGSENEANAAYEKLMNEGIIVRPVGNYGLGTALRITFGKPEENEQVIKVLSS